MFGVRKFLIRRKYKFPRLLLLIRIFRSFIAGLFEYHWGFVSLNVLAPWSNNNKSSTARLKIFRDVNKRLESAIKAGEFILSQFQHTEDHHHIVRQLYWRHYVLVQSIDISLARLKDRTNDLRLIEFGACDGMTAFIAMEYLKHNSNFHGRAAIQLVDAWGLLADKKASSNNISSALNDYYYLELEHVRSNLKDFSPNVHFCQGVIPDVIPKVVPKDWDWIHIDLNSDLATAHALECVLTNTSQGAVIIFDDYGSADFNSTRVIVDEILKQYEGLALEYPTGQLVFVRS